MVGSAVGLLVIIKVGVADRTYGFLVGAAVGVSVGFADGARVGEAVGTLVGTGIKAKAFQYINAQRKGKNC